MGNPFLNFRYNFYSFLMSLHEFELWDCDGMSNGWFPQQKPVGDWGKDEIYFFFL